MLGNRITANALSSDNGEKLISKALAEIKKEYKISPAEQGEIFKGRYYQADKVGSLITKADQDGRQVILKLQLRPLPFDEGFIIRQIQPQIKTDKIRLPQVYLDQPWRQEKGYGFLIMEDLSAIPNLWSAGFPLSDQEMQNHKKFLQIFFKEVLPLKPFLPEPTQPANEIFTDSFNHFAKIAQASQFQHLDQQKFKEMKTKYFEVLENADFQSLHFTHGHLAGLDIKYDQAHDVFIILANLMWSYRFKYYELAFPIWNNLMHVNTENFSFDNFLQIVKNWCQLFSQDLFDLDLTQTREFWLLLLERAILTCMIDLGASEWLSGEERIKENLLLRWQEFFDWILKNKL